MKPYHLFAQKFSYSSVAKDSYANDINYLIGNDGDNVIVWLYNKQKHILQANLYDDDMKVLNEKTFQSPDIDELLQFSFLKKNTGRNIIIQYSKKGKIITQFFSFDRTQNAIVSGEILEETDVYTGLITKQSENNKYTGFVKGYLTTQDSVLIQYSLYNKENNPVYNISITLPYQNRRLYLEDAMVDNAGNLYLYETAGVQATYDQAITIYEINVNKDSLITNQISQPGIFSNIHIKQSNITGNAAITGVLSRSSDTSSAPEKSAVAYLFLQQLNENLTPQNAMMLIPFPSALNPPYSVSPNFQITNFTESKDSSYIFYAGGLSNLKNKRIVGTGSAASPSGLGNSGITSVIDHPFGSGNITPVSGGPFSLYTTAMSDAFNRYAQLPIGSPVYSDPVNNLGSGTGTGAHTVFFGGDNFFLTTTVSGTKLTSSQLFSDTTLYNSEPEFDFTVNTGKSIQYIYSRILKNKKQVIYNVVASENGASRQYPLISKSNYRVLINNGVQVSANSVVFPYLDNKKVAFVRLHLK